MRSLGLSVGCAVLFGCSPSSHAPSAGQPRDPADIAAQVDKLTHRGPAIQADPIRHRARVTLDEQTPGAFQLEDIDSGVTAGVALAGVQPVGARRSGSYVVHPGALAGGDLLHAVAEDGIEDFVTLPSPGLSSVDYRVTLGGKVAGLRLVAGTLELLDAAGAPRLRAGRTFVFGSDGSATRARIDVSGCAVDRNPRAPWGRAVTPPGAAACDVRVSWDPARIAYPAVLDPSWTATGTLNSPRAFANSAFLDADPTNGVTAMVVVAGPEVVTSVDGAPATYTELYDPTSGTFATTGILADVPRYGATFTTVTRTVTDSCTDCGTVNLSHAGEYVLNVGGFQSDPEPCNATNPQQAQGFVALYDPVAGDWTTSIFPDTVDANSQFVAKRGFHTATLVPGVQGTDANAGKVLLVGGRTTCAGTDGTDFNNGAVTDAALFDPDFVGSLDLDAFTDLPTANQQICGHAYHTATAAGSVIVVAGGYVGTTANELTASPCVEAYDPSSATLGSFTRLDDLPDPLARHTAGAVTLGGDLQVLVAGGFDSSCTALDPGTLDCVGGAGVDGTTGLATAYALDLAGGGWSSAASLATARLGATATGVGGEVLVVGGLATTTGPVITTSEMFDPDANSGAGGWDAATLVAPRYAHSASLMPQAGGCPGTILVAGGVAVDGENDPLTTAVTSAEVLDPTLGQSCGSSSDCCTGNCVDGVCCDTTCDGGGCQVCSAAAGATADGTCTLLGSGATCADGGTNPCSLDTCDGVDTACQHAPNPGVTCRAAAGPCDVAETCPADSTICPDDAFLDGTNVCRPANGACDVAESCTGTSAACPTDGFASGSTICRPANGACDVAETCTGTSPACPTDGFASNSTVCRAANGACDVAERCTGTSPACPADGFASNSTVCRPANGACDVAERCTGASPTCPADGFASNSTICRPANGACDVAERCTGASPTCPADGFAGDTTICRPASGACDVAERCTGASSACPPDGFASNGTVCRPASGVCDVAESCTGTSAACPADALAPAGTACTSDGNPCTVDTCSGTQVTCQHVPLACPTATPVCNPSGTLAGQCTACSAGDSSVCTTQGQVCDTTSGTCVQCNVDGDCASAPQGKVCDTAHHVCVGCLVGTDCASGVCDLVTDTCGATPTPDAGVSPSPDTGGSANSDARTIVIDAPTGLPDAPLDARIAPPDAAVAPIDAPVAPIDAPRDVSFGNDVAARADASSVDAGAADATRPDAATFDARVSGVQDAAGDASAMSGSAKGGGCSCQMSGSNSPGAGPILVGLAFATMLGVVRRRRGRRSTG